MQRVMAAESAPNFSLLHRTCSLVVLLCFLHISVTLVFYIRSLDIRFAFVQNQQTSHNGSLPLPGAATVASGSEGLKGGWTPRNPEENRRDPAEGLQKCPETSPLLGKTLGGHGSRALLSHMVNGHVT